MVRGSILNVVYRQDLELQFSKRKHARATHDKAAAAAKSEFDRVRGVGRPPARGAPESEADVTHAHLMQHFKAV
eukprot:11285664-Alexandrium_andersonii.AAC.1